PKRARTKRNDFRRFVRNRESDSPPEAIEETTALIARNEAGLDERPLLILRPEMPKQQVPAARCITDSEPRNRVAVEPAVFEIGAGRFPLQAAFKLFDEVRLRFAVDFHQHRTLLVLASFLRRTLPRAGQRDATFFGDDPHRFGKGALLHFHNKFENIATLSAAKAVINLFRRMNVERRSFLGMKRAKAAKVLPRLFQLEVFADYADDIRLLLHLLRQGSRFCHTIRAVPLP